MANDVVITYDAQGRVVSILENGTLTTFQHVNAGA